MKDAMVVISYVPERREVGVESVNKWDSRFGDINVGLLYISYIFTSLSMLFEAKILSIKF